MAMTGAEPDTAFLWISLWMIGPVGKISIRISSPICVFPFRALCIGIGMRIVIMTIRMEFAVQKILRFHSCLPGNVKKP